MSAVLEDKAEQLLGEWGLGGLTNERLYEHATNVIQYRGKTVDKVIVGLGLMDEQGIQEALRSKPTDINMLEYLRRRRDSGVWQRYEEIHCITEAVPYIASSIPSLRLHDITKKRVDLNRIREEMTLTDVLPMSVGGRLILIFRQYEKLAKFVMMGKADKHESEFYRTMAQAEGMRVEQAYFHTAAISETLFNHYQQQLNEISQGSEVADEALQTIMYSDGDRDAVMKSIVTILDLGLNEDVNDIAIVPDRDTARGRVFFRKYQTLVNSGIELSPGNREAVTRMLLARSKANPSGARLRHPVDGNLNFQGRSAQAFLRMSFLPLEESSLPSTSVSARIFPKTAKAIHLNGLSIPEHVQRELEYFSERKYGLFVVCGPTGSGKSTTIAGMLGHHHEVYGESMKRISVEQPCERILPGVLHIDVSQHHYQNTNGAEVDKFAMALRAILRHDPDLIFVGEVRDKESCTVSVDSANTGHLVFTTTHANAPVLGYRRLASFLDKERRFDLVNVLQGILAQRLLPLLCPHCSEQVPFNDTDMDHLERYARTNGLDLGGYETPQIHGKANIKGCDKCINGYASMVPVHGLLTMNPAVRELLLSPNESDWMKAQQASDSKITLFDSAFQYYAQGRAQLGSILL